MQALILQKKKDENEKSLVEMNIYKNLFYYNRKVISCIAVR